MNDDQCKCGFRAPELGPHPACPIHAGPVALTDEEIRAAIEAVIEDDHEDDNVLAAMIADRVVSPLLARLKAAEDLCVMYSWSAGRHVTNREKAAHELWRRWYGIVGSDFLTADAHPDLSDAMVDLLAAQRDETRARTLARIRSDAPTELPGGEG